MLTCGLTSKLKKKRENKFFPLFSILFFFLFSFQNKLVSSFVVKKTLHTLVEVLVFSFFLKRIVP